MRTQFQFKMFLVTLSATGLAIWTVCAALRSYGVL